MVNVDGEEFKRTLPQSYELYQKYQIVIHHDPPKNMKAYQEHLQHSPLKVANQSNKKCLTKNYKDHKYAILIRMLTLFTAQKNRGFAERGLWIFSSAILAGHQVDRCWGH